MALAPDAVLIKSKPSAIDLEELLLRVPVLSLTTHAFAKDAGVQFAAASVPDAIQDAIRLRRQFLAQPLLEVRSDAAGQTQHVYEGPRRTAVFGPPKQAGNVRSQSWNRRGDADAYIDAYISEGLHRLETRVG